MLNQNSRISSKLLISKLLKKGSLYKNQVFSFKFLPSIESHSRFAVIVSGKICKDAVDRNHLKRQINEIIRLNQAIIPIHMVCLVILKPSPKLPDYITMEKAIIDFLGQLRFNGKAS